MITCSMRLCRLWPCKPLNLQIINISQILPIKLHSFLETFGLGHTNTFARLDRVNKQLRNASHFLVSPSLLSPLPLKYR